MKRWNLIFRVFTAEYLGLKPEKVTEKRTGRNGSDLVRLNFRLLLYDRDANLTHFEVASVTPKYRFPRDSVLCVSTITYPTIP